MVSFQCHACGDVVKKPKLDQHRSRCHTGFDCIDCSTTFNTPADYKGHTQCISEAEKYEKSLYKGPKTAVFEPRNNYPPQPPIHRGSYGYGGRGGRGGWGQPRSSATGANDTPLGTPSRMSPVASPALTPQPTIVQQVKKPAGKAPEQPKPAPVPEAAKASTSANKDEDKKDKKDKDKKKDKKRKSTVAEDTIADSGDLSSKRAKIVDEAIDSAAIPPASPSEVDGKKKKSKKDKKDKASANGGAVERKVDVEDVEMSAPAEQDTKKKSKEQKKGKKRKEAESTKDDQSSVTVNSGDAQVSAPAGDNTEEVKDKKKSSDKSKKRKRNEDGEEAAVKKTKAEDAMDVESSTLAAADQPIEKKEKKNKKEKKEKVKKSKAP